MSISFILLGPSPSDMWGTFCVDPSQNRYLQSDMSQKTHIPLNKPRCRNIVKFVLWREILACVFAIYVTDASILPSLSFLLFQQFGFVKKCRNENQKLRRTNWMSYVTCTGSLVATTTQRSTTATRRS